MDFVRISGTRCWGTHIRIRILLARIYLYLGGWSWTLKEDSYQRSIHASGETKLRKAYLRFQYMRLLILKSNKELQIINTIRSHPMTRLVSYLMIMKGLRSLRNLKKEPSLFKWCQIWDIVAIKSKLRFLKILSIYWVNPVLLNT